MTEVDDITREYHGSRYLEATVQEAETLMLSWSVSAVKVFGTKVLLTVFYIAFFYLIL